MPVVVLVFVWGAALYLAALLVPGVGPFFRNAHGAMTTRVLPDLMAAAWWERILLVLGFALTIFYVPVLLAAHRLAGLFGYKRELFGPELWGSWWPLGWVVLLWLSWLFWSFTISRTLRLVDLWSPFLRVRRGRRRLLRGWVRFRQWLEFRRFGEGPVAAWAGFLEVISCRYLDGDVFLGRPKLAVGGLLRPVGIPTEKHMVTLASTGAGKSTAALIPNLCLHRGSLLCVDPKGELATITAARRGNGHANGSARGVKGLGQKVFVLDPFKIVPGWPSASYNVFDEMARVAAHDSDRPVTYAGKIAAALVKKLSEKDRYFDDAAETLLRGLILYIFVHETEKTLVRLRQLIARGDLEAFERQIRSEELDPRDGRTPYDVLIDNMIGARSGPYGEVISAAALSIRMMGGPQMGSVITTAQEHTAFLDAPEFQRICTHSDFLLDDLKGEPISVYLCLPINMVAGKEGRWLRMFVMLTIDMMDRGQVIPDPPILLAVDEFPSLGRLDDIERVAPTLRSRGVRFWVIAQDLAQLMHVYPGEWHGFIGNAEAVQFLGTVEPITVKWLVEKLGHHVVKVRMRNGQQSRLVDEIRPLLDQDQAARLLDKDWQNQIVWRGSKRPMLLKTAPYYQYLPFWYYDADRRFPEKLSRRMWRWIG